MKLLIAIVTANPHSSRRHICREGWMQQLEGQHDVQAEFCVGQNSSGGGELFECYVKTNSKGERLLGALNCVTLPCEDNYVSLPLKVRWICTHALANRDFDFLFKCDDDTFIHVARLVARAKEAQERGEDYVGSLQGNPKFAEGGAGYLLSRKAVEIIARAEAPKVGMEDAWVGSVLHRARITAIHDSRFKQSAKTHPAPENNQITSHFMRSLTTAKELQAAIGAAT